MYRPTCSAASTLSLWVLCGHGHLVYKYTWSIKNCAIWCNIPVPSSNHSLEAFNPQMAGVPYTEQNHLHGKRREFRIRNIAQRTKENDVKTILFSLAYKASVFYKYRHRLPSGPLWTVLKALEKKTAKNIAQD